MSQKKAQLIDPNETFTATSIKVNSGVVSATSFAGNLTGNVGGLVAAASSSVVSVGVITATDFRGDGTNLTNMSSVPALVGQTTVTSGATHTLDISKGNVVFFKPLHNSTVSFANTGQTRTMQIEMEVKIPTQGKSITWPANVIWGDVYAPTRPPGIVSNTSQDAKQIFSFTKVEDDSKDLWVAEESVRIDPQAAVGYIWGYGYNGNLGINLGGNTQRSSPVLMGGEKKYWRADEYSNCRTATPSHDKYSIYNVCCNGSLWGWGYGDEGSLAGCVGGLVGSVLRTTYYSSPVQISQTIDGYCTDVAQVSGHTKGGAVLATDGTLWVWGRTYCGQGFNCTKISYCKQSCSWGNASPCQCRDFNNWKTLNTGTGSGHNAIKADGTLWSWGISQEGVLGNNKNQNVSAWADGASAPVQICGGGYWSDVTRSEHAAIGIRSTTSAGCGALWAWGSNTCGGLGIDAATNTSFSSPVRITGHCCWTAVGALGKSAFWARKGDDCMFVWGSNAGGMLGLNDTATRTTPVHLPGNWVRLSSSGVDCAALGIRTDGTLWAWGSNRGGANGVNDSCDSIEARSSPVQVGTDTDWNPRGGLGTFCNNSFAFKSS